MYKRRCHYKPLPDPVKKLLRHKATLGGILLMILIIGAIGIWLIITLRPYFGAVIAMYKQGIKGILEAITPLL
jgi:hypothetical protein